MINKGFRLVSDYLDSQAQKRLLDVLRPCVAAAPFYRPVMPRSGRPFSVVMTNLGPLGWVSDKAGYRYQSHHPETGEPWPELPDEFLALWNDLTAWPVPPQCCLVNFYRDGKARMGLHRDEDEEDRKAPVLSISLGDTAVFRMGGLERRGPTQSVKLNSGDAMILENEARHAYHGIDRILTGSSSLLRDGGRLNLTFRRVTPV